MLYVLRVCVCVCVYRSDGCLPTNTSRVLWHLRLAPTAVLCTVATLKRCARFQVVCPYVGRVIPSITQLEVF